MGGEKAGLWLCALAPRILSMASVSSLKSLNGQRRGKDIFISYGREEGVKVGLREEHNLL